MKVFVAGASGALGLRLVPQLVARGHEVIGMTRTPSKQDLLRALGARPVIADGLDPDAVARAVAEAEPDVIVHQLTALKSIDMRHFDRTFALTNRLRTEGTDHLLAAGRAVGVRRVVAQSFAGWPFARTAGRGQDRGGPARSAAALGAAGHARRDPPRRARGDRDRLGRGRRAALRRLLRPGHEPQQRPAGRRWRRSCASASSRWSATAPACGRSSTSTTPRPRPSPPSSTAPPGIYQVVDDEPAPVSEWLPTLAKSLGRQAAAPPAALARPAGRRRGRDRHDDRGAGRVEREGQARAGLAAALHELADRLRGGTRMSDGVPLCRAATGARSRSPTGCWAA